MGYFCDNTLIYSNNLAMRSTKQSKNGFTLVEVMIVVFIIGVLAALALPMFAKYLRNTRAASFVSDIRSLASAGNQYALEAGEWVPSTSPGEYPEALEGYFSQRKFNLGTSLGGVWDFDQDDIGYFTSAVGVVGPTESDELFAIVDKRIDDGNLATGLFQKLASDRYYYIIED